jgi:hypothetical protein
MGWGFTSEPVTVAQVLEGEKDIHYKAAKRIPPPSFNDVWESLREVLSNGAHDLPSADVALKILTDAMIEEYWDETDFDEALFAALRNCLAAFELPQPDDDNILLKVGETQEFAVGIGRQKSPFDLYYDALQQNRTARSSYISSEMEIESISDHVVCLFHKSVDQWSVTDCFSVAKLESIESTCETFCFSEYDWMMDPELWNRHGPIGQVLLYNMELVLPFSARRGVLDNYIPLAVIAGKKWYKDRIPRQAEKARLQVFQKAKKKVMKKAVAKILQKAQVGKPQTKTIFERPRKRALRWVSGTLHVPPACGGCFYYSINDFGQFSDNDENESIKQALAIYVGAVRFGLEAAIKVQKKLAAREIPLAVPASGQALMIGGVMLKQLHFCASPIPGAIASQNPDVIESWSASQGELFQGRLNVNVVLQNCSKSFIDFRSGSKQNTVTSDVVVKVSSISVHDLLIRPTDASLALKRIVSAGSGLVEEIGTVLLAVVEPGPNLVTIMVDLTKKGYGALKPVENGNQLNVLWAGFEDLVERILLPMAKLGIIHADIRPGWDKTSNIMCKLGIDKSGVTKATLKLIDYESFVLWECWKADVFDGRYIKEEPGWDATTYLWWQCMAVANTWKESLIGGSLRTDSSLHNMKTALLRDIEGPIWLHKYRDCAKGKIDDTALKRTLEDLADEFSRNTKPIAGQFIQPQSKRVL